VPSLRGDIGIFQDFVICITGNLKKMKGFLIFKGGQNQYLYTKKNEPTN